MTGGNIVNSIKEALSCARLPFEIIGIILFGSRSTGKAAPESDFDLLIIADGINPKRQRRGEDVLAVKRHLPPLPFDILLFSPAEAVSNFENHNPLFLDIAEDGIILSDKNNFLSCLVEETKAYIRARDIKKLKDGWEFPVKAGVATYLSRVSNKDFSTAMVNDGERDYLIGVKLSKEGFYDKAVYHFQQAVEKCVKAVLIAFGVFHKTPFVGMILKGTLESKDIPEAWKGKLIALAEISEGIEPDVSLSRYPGIINDILWLPAREYERDDAEIAKKKAEDALSVAKDFLGYWFS